MIRFLYIMGIVTIVGGAVLGFIADSFFGMLACWAVAAANGAVYFALAKTMSRQEVMSCQLEAVIRELRKQTAMKTCGKCGKEYDEEQSYCPGCGFRESKA